MGLTAVSIRSAKPEAKVRRLFDGGGLYLEIAPSGGKYWRFKYRFAGKEKRISLGVYREVTLKEARDKRDAAKRLLSDGIDPSAARKRQKTAQRQAASNTFEAVALEWQLKHGTGWSMSHTTRTRELLKRDLCPWLGAQPIVQIQAPDLLSVLRRIEERGALATAHRARGICGQIFRYAIATGRAERDPSGDLRGALPPPQGTHFAAVTNPKELGVLLQTLDGYQGTLTVRCALRLAPLVFVRPGELRHAKWEGIDFEKGEWRYLVNKTKTSHIVPLAKQAVAILQEVRPLTGHGEYVFPSARTPRGERPMSDNAILAAMRRLDIPKEQMSGHGFRAVARTLLDEELRFRPDIIEHQLAHAVRDPNGRAYNRTAHLEERTKMMQSWADYLDELKSAEVIAKRGKEQAQWG